MVWRKAIAFVVILAPQVLFLIAEDTSFKQSRPFLFVGDKKIARGFFGADKYLIDAFVNAKGIISLRFDGQAETFGNFGYALRVHRSLLVLIGYGWIGIRNIVHGAAGNLK